ncbi:tyrosine-type recombinase/integrase [Streptomyces levis]|uniref:tyrosine-type recombinase/integrase n=1 Tax=Streptomyces levis TaxID=285566 RepID=UPI003C7A0CDB
MLTFLCRGAGVRRVRVHDLRHTFASLLLAHGVDARTIMETLGHSTITMTLDWTGPTRNPGASRRQTPRSDRRSTALVSAVDVKGPLE